MDTFITIIMWIAGFYAGFILLMAIGFGAGGASQNSELGLFSLASTFLFLYLIYAGVTSLFTSDDLSTTKQIKSEKSVSVAVSEKMDQVMEVDVSEDNIILWFIYAFMFFPVPIIVYLFYRKLHPRKTT